MKRTDNQAVVAEYRYNGLGFRVGWHYDVDADGTVENTSDDPWFYFAYDEGWRMVATYRSTDSSPKEQFVHHMAGMAGLGGFGGSSYIDGVILRERDANTAWASAADGTLEERLYYAQNWRADVVAIVSSAGKLVERARYSAYGIPTAFPAGDTNSDGDWDATDSADIGSNYTPGSAYAVRRDADLDGDVDVADVTHANGITGGYQTLGCDVLTSAAVRNRIGYAGYQYDPTFAGLDRHLYHVRHRVYDAEAGRWTRRDPMGYVDSRSLYSYSSNTPCTRTDALGTTSSPCLQSSSCGGPGHSPDTAMPPGVTYADRNQCKNEAINDPAFQSLMKYFQNTQCLRRCEVPTITCTSIDDCGGEYGRYFAPCTIRICYKTTPNCEEVKATVFHELLHAYFYCLGKNRGTCESAICSELNAYRFDGTCCRDINRKPGEGYHDCLRRWVRNSVGSGCTDAEFDATYPNLLTSCFPQYLPLPGGGSPYQCEFPG